MKRLIAILGPTAVGKTAYAIQLAQELGTEILSCDSRQFYQELNIGVARPSTNELAAVKHHFIACRSIHSPYNVFSYQEEALSLLQSLFVHHDTVVAVGGSGLYVDALCQGIAILPDPAPGLREALQQRIREEGLAVLCQELLKIDPATYHRIDLQNPVRVQRALEVSLTAGRPYSEVLQQHMPQRPFTVEKRALTMATPQLRHRIDRRVEQMMADGLEAEAQRLYPYRSLMPLQTVGYKEFFAQWEQHHNLDTKALAQIQTDIKNHTWQYAKKQLTWLRRYADIQWLPQD